MPTQYALGVFIGTLPVALLFLATWLRTMQTGKMDTLLFKDILDRLGRIETRMEKIDDKLGKISDRLTVLETKAGLIYHD
jgi:hypothetical protein